MSSKSKQPLHVRVAEAAEGALAEQGYVSLIDVLLRVGYLHPVRVDGWRKGRVACLEEWIFVAPEHVQRATALFHEWARRRNLPPMGGDTVWNGSGEFTSPSGGIKPPLRQAALPPSSEAADLAPTAGPQRNLQFSRSGDPAVERAYRTHYLSPALPEKKQEKLREKLSKPPELVVFDIYKESKCSECETELDKGSLLFMEANRALCLECADPGHLVYLPRGDATLTRRARKFSTLSAVVVKFARARGRYERQGALVEEAALQKAEAECLSDADGRARKRERAAILRVDEEEKVATALALRILELFPRCPPEEARTIAEHAAERGSGRIGRTAAGRRLEDESVRLAVIASIRHRHTNYDEILMETADRPGARAQVRDQIHEILRAWGPAED
jgi:hypothetical protein